MATQEQEAEGRIFLFIDTGGGGGANFKRHYRMHPLCIIYIPHAILSTVKCQMADFFEAGENLPKCGFFTKKMSGFPYRGSPIIGGFEWRSIEESKYCEKDE